MGKIPQAIGVGVGITAGVLLLKGIWVKPIGWIHIGFGVLALGVLFLVPDASSTTQTGT